MPKWTKITEDDILTLLLSSNICLIVTSFFMFDTFSKEDEFFPFIGITAGIVTIILSDALRFGKIITRNIYVSLIGTISSYLIFIAGYFCWKFNVI